MVGFHGLRCHSGRYFRQRTKLRARLRAEIDDWVPCCVTLLAPWGSLRGRASFTLIYCAFPYSNIALSSKNRDLIYRMAEVNQKTPKREQAAGSVAYYVEVICSIYGRGLELLKEFKDRLYVQQKAEKAFNGNGNMNRADILQNSLTIKKERIEKQYEGHFKLFGNRFADGDSKLFAHTKLSQS